jgi:hypothetical protein
MLRQCEQRLERGKETASHRAGATGMVAEAHRKRNWSPAWNRRRISEDGRNRRALSGRLGTTATGSIGIKTGQRGDPRPRRGFKTGQRGDPRLWSQRAEANHRRQRQRTLSRTHRTSAESRPQRQSDLAGPGGRSWLHRQLSERQALYQQTPRIGIGATALCRHRHSAWRRSAGRLRRRTHGPGSPVRPLSPHTLVCANARLQSHASGPRCTRPHSADSAARHAF